MFDAVPARETLRLVDDEFRANAMTLSAPPTRFYLNLTEACNLRCAHCITGAPEKTVNGTARTMSIDVLDALAPHLAHASYVGLTHAGEPITAPLFAPLLERLRARRAGAPTVVHVLTNGLALTERKFVEACALGVSSFSFSVDGMSAPTHDLVRIGSKIDRLLGRIRHLVDMRNRHFPAVRMGIAWVVTRSNLAELEALIRFVKQAGLDWVKLEELVPVNAFSAAELVDPIELDIAATRALAFGDALGVRVLDHTRAIDVWKCKLDLSRSMARYSRDDDFANRMDINPCRLPLEVVCVEPNGDVKPIDFFQPVAGNVLEKDLGELWNAPPFLVARTRTLMRRPCGKGRPYCAPDPGPRAW
jgi:cyclomaltodextrinase / maltogenic alpha-amylase / neopullulanase